MTLAVSPGCATSWDQCARILAVWCTATHMSWPQAPASASARSRDVPDWMVPLRERSAPPFRCCSDADLNKPEKLASTRRGDERYACGMSVGVVFGLPDDGINGIMEALRTRQDRIRFVQVHHEESAAWPALTRSGREGFTYVSRRLARADASPDRSLRPSSVRRS